MKRFVMLGLMWVCNALASSNWLTMVGDPLDSAVATIQIDPSTVAVSGDKRTMLIRVTRPQKRVSTDGVAFRSYQASVQFDCTAKTARFMTADFYEQPLWQGKPHKSMAYGPTQIRPLVFRYFDANPLDKLVRAACLGASGAKN